MQSKMGMPVHDILALDLLSSAEVICGHEGLSNPITSVNVMEVPDIVPWLQKGEFLLTTAYSIRDNLEKLNELIPKMHEIGVAGLGLKTKRYIETLPDSVIATANSLGFPIIRIPLEISYGDIISAILTTVVNKQATLLMQIDAFNNRLKDIMLKGGDLLEIAIMIGDLVHAPVAITEDLFKDYVLYADGSIKEQLTYIIEANCFKKQSKIKRGQRVQNLEEQDDFLDGQSVRRVMIPIYSDDMFYGYVIIWNIDELVASKTLFMIEAAASLIALHSAKKLSVYENENKHKIEFLEELLSSQESRQLRALEKAAYFDFHPELAYGVLYAKLGDSTLDMQMTPNNAQILKAINAKLVSVVERLQRLYKGNLVYGNKSNRVIFLLGFDQDTPKSEHKSSLMSLGEHMISFAKLEGIEQKLQIGIGRVYEDFRQLHKSYGEAERAIHKMQLSKSDERLLHFDELGIYGFLSNEVIQPELEQFFLEVLGPILIYDQEKGAELLNTLKMYYACGCNLKRVSEEMYTHYNTVIYRMQRIKEIGNFDFNDPNTSLNVHIAIKILDVIQLDLTTLKPEGSKRR
jgi:purine catabolism regulator